MFKYNQLNVITGKDYEIATIQIYFVSFLTGKLVINNEMPLIMKSDLKAKCFYL